MRLRSCITLLLTIVIFCVLTFCGFNVNHKFPDGSVTTWFFEVGDNVLVRLAGAYFAAKIISFKRGAVTVRFKDGGTASVNKQYISPDNITNK